MAPKSSRRREIQLHPVLAAIASCAVIAVVAAAGCFVLAIPFIFFAMSNSSPYRRCVGRDDARLFDVILCLRHG